MANNKLREMRIKQVADFRASGKTAREWCKENGQQLSTLRYWITKINRQKSLPSQEFVAYTPKTTEPTPIGIRIGNYKIEVNPGFDPTTFIEAIRLLKSL